MVTMSRDPVEDSVSEVMSLPSNPVPAGPLRFLVESMQRRIAVTEGETTRETPSWPRVAPSREHMQLRPSHGRQHPGRVA
jgi:hypothetical protein